MRLSRGAEGTNVDGARDWSAATAWSESNRSRREGVIPLLVDALLRPNGGTNGEGRIAGSAPTCAPWRWRWRIAGSSLGRKEKKGKKRVVPSHPCSDQRARHWDPTVTVTDRPVLSVESLLTRQQ